MQTLTNNALAVYLEDLLAYLIDGTPSGLSRGVRTLF